MAARPQRGEVIVDVPQRLIGLPIGEDGVGPAAFERFAAQPDQRRLLRPGKTDLFGLAHVTSTWSWSGSE